MKWLKRILQSIGLIKTDQRGVFHMDVHTLNAVQKLALQEQRPEDEVAAELLSAALRQRRYANEGLKQWSKLSQREKEVTALICKGMTYNQIADYLHISLGTVKTYLRKSFKKLGVSSSTELRDMLYDWDFDSWLAK